MYAHFTVLLTAAASSRADTLHGGNKRWAVVTYLGGNGRGPETHGYMYGVYSIKTRMKALGMSARVDQVVFYNHATPKTYIEVLEGWLGPENVIFTDIEHLLNPLLKKSQKREVWAAVFSKLVFFNLTRYDRLITLDNDVLIRQSIEHWFWDYPPPAATHARAEMEWNSGAMVINPSKSVFRKLIGHVNATRRWKKEYFTDRTFADNWNSGIGQQGFLSAYFTHDDTPDRMSTMPYGNSILSSDLRLERNLYFWKFRNRRIETVHLTTDKPWRAQRGKSDPVICEVLWEWNRSVTGIGEYGVAPLRSDYLSDCLGTGL